MLNLSGSNTGDQTITLTGDVTGSGIGSFAATIVANGVTFSKMQQIAPNSILGNDGVAPIVPIELTPAKIKSMLLLSNVENTALST
jgi:hypothetical protein